MNNGICQVGFTTKGYRCVCVPGSAGANCAGIVKFIFSQAFPDPECLRNKFDYRSKNREKKLLIDTKKLLKVLNSFYHK